MQWTTVNTSSIPADIFDQFHCVAHLHHLYATAHSKKDGCFIVRISEPNFSDTIRIDPPPNTYGCTGLVSHNGHLYFLASPRTSEDRDQHLVIYKLTDEKSSPAAADKSATWQKVARGRCPSRQLFPAFFAMGPSLVLAGGRGEKNSLTSVSDYDLLSGQWMPQTQWPDLPKPAQQQQPVILNDYCHLIDGLVMVDGTVQKIVTSVYTMKMKEDQPAAAWKHDHLSSPPNPSCGACHAHKSAVVVGGFTSDVIASVHVWAKNIKRGERNVIINARRKEKKRKERKEEDVSP